MKICFYLAHPAHFHLFKNVIKKLQKNHDVLILYNEKDVLDHLIKSEKSFTAIKIKTNKVGNSFTSLIRQFIQKNIGTYKALKKYKPDLVMGTPILVSIIGVFLRYKSIIVNEDDFDIVKLTANFGYPFADHIICPEVIRKGKYEKKCITYQGYHELAYLHPEHFTPNSDIAATYVDLDKPYFLIRFAKLTAHHDVNIRGIDSKIAATLIEELKPHGNVYITSERPLEEEFEQYRIAVDPINMHHVMAFSTLYIGDSQTMAAEAGVLGVPFIRYNDFVGRISYLDELENKYKLGYGIKPDSPQKLIDKTDELLSDKNLSIRQAEKRERMLSEKINVADFLVWFVNNYPGSLEMEYNTANREL